MSLPEYIDLSSDDETEAREVNDVKPITPSGHRIAYSQPNHGVYRIKHEQTHDLINGGGSHGSYLAERGRTPASTSYDSSASLCRQFWKSGEYEVRQAPQGSQSGKNRLRIHPKFLHSNATSHKWAFGAIAELLDNAIDEVQNGATFVSVDKFTNPRKGEAALLIQDDGGGMSPDSLRQCMSFGFSDKQSDALIGQYGNGFKTSTMRLGADVIVFSRSANKRLVTQSVGLLSYTFLRQTGCDDIVVPVVDYEFDPLTGAFGRLLRTDAKQFSSNLSAILRWCPFASETELLEQFNDIGHHGTKVIVFNLWYDDDGEMELDFESDSKDLLINNANQRVLENRREHELTKKNIAYTLQYSLRAYSSILYLRVPETFKIILRGDIVMPYNVLNGLNYLECIMYRPQVEDNPEVVTSIGFVKGAPIVNVHGFNVYHKNRLILPFWHVASNSYGKGRGVVGVLETNFIKPTHNKQDFEKSSIYQKLETRLKEMTYEYWDLHAYLIGYKTVKKPIAAKSPAVPVSPPLRTYSVPRHKINGRFTTAVTSQAPVITDPKYPVDNKPHRLAICNSADQTGSPQKRKLENVSPTNPLKRLDVAGLSSNHNAQQEPSAVDKRREEIKTMKLENKKLQEQCTEFEEREKELSVKEEKLKRELRSYQLLYEKLSEELNSPEVKVEKS